LKELQKEDVLRIQIFRYWHFCECQKFRRAKKIIQDQQLIMCFDKPRRRLKVPTAVLVKKLKL